jgi:hypothetical protein
MQVTVPELQVGLLGKPLLDDEQTVDDASLVFRASRLFSCLNHSRRYDMAMGFRNGFFVEFAWDYLLQLVLESQGDLGDLFRGNRTGKSRLVTGG